MRGVVRPLVAVLLLVGVGMAAADHVCPATRNGPICALLVADDDDLLRIGHVVVVVPQTPTVAPSPPRALALTLPPATAPVVATDPLIDAPKTSPPA